MVGGWVDPRKAVDYVDWALLLLVGSALGLSKAITNSGLAGYAGEAIRKSGMSASASIYVLFGFTMVRHGVGYLRGFMNRLCVFFLPGNLCESPLMDTAPIL